MKKKIRETDRVIITNGKYKGKKGTVVSQSIGGDMCLIDLDWMIVGSPEWIPIEYIIR